MAQVNGTNSSETIDAADGVTNGNDVIDGRGGNDNIFGLGGNDTIAGGAGADKINGGAGFDKADYTDSPERVFIDLMAGVASGGDAEGDTLVSIEGVRGSDHNDVLVGNNGNNSLFGFGGDDLLKGGGGDDILEGRFGDDTLKGGGGADFINGYVGIDTVSYHDSPDGVSISLLEGYARGGDAQGDTLESIENLTGSAFGDALFGDHDANVLRGNDGNDWLKGYGGHDTLVGSDGNDTLDGSSGNDTMIGGLGNDTYTVTETDYDVDVVVERAGEGIDTVLVGEGTAYTLPEGVDVEILRSIHETPDTEQLTLTGNSSNNVIIGNNGVNFLYGGGGNDELVGLDGDDAYFVDSQSDIVVESGGEGFDVVTASVSYALTNGADIELLRTADPLATTALALTGNSSGNLIQGNAGDNVLNGRDGNDEMFGFTGRDSFLFDTALDAAFNVDRILDFNVADDTILLDQDIFSSSLGLGNISSSELVIGPAAQDANDRIIYNPANGALFYDSDGVGGTAAIRFAVLSTGLVLTDLDFLVVA